MQGIVLSTTACVIWGFFPLYFHWLAHISSIEVLVERIIWSFISTLLIVLVLPRRRFELWRLLRTPPALLLLSLSASLIAANWLVFIWAASHHLFLQASLGYFISPLIALIMGWLLLQERIHLLQKSAGLLALLAVSWELWQLGSLPWVTCALALLFAVYGFLHKIHLVDGMNAFVVEVMLLIPPCIIYLLWQSLTGQYLYFGHQPTDSLLLIGSGVVTALALVLFNVGIQKTNYSVVGFIMYINPSIQFLVAIFILHAPVRTEQWVTFAIVWMAMVLFLAGMLSQAKRS